MKTGAACNWPRRKFLKLAGAASVCGLSPTGFAAGTVRVCLIIDPENAAASSVPAKRAIACLARELDAKGIRHELASSIEAAEGASFCIVLANSESHLA